jgi:hypothetical protein
MQARRVVTALALLTCPLPSAAGRLIAQTSAPAAWQATPASVLKSALRSAVAAQARYREVTGTYSGTVDRLALPPTPGVQLEILYADANAWLARATHQARPGRSCVVFAGSLEGREPPRTDHDREMAGEAGIPLCDWMP